MDRFFIGIDPGKQGFFCIMNSFNDELIFARVPLIGNGIDILALSELLDSIPLNSEPYCVIEDVHAIFGSSAKATFSFGFVCGLLEMGLVVKDIPYTKVQPKKWQKEMWEGIPLQKKPSTTGKTIVTDTKKMSLLAAKRLFPKVDLRATERSKKPHDGKIDSLLIAEYCRRKFWK